MVTHNWFKNCLTFNFVSINISMENVIFFTMQRRTGISDLSLENICAMIFSIRKIKPTKEIVIRDHLLICNKTHSLTNFLFWDMGIINTFLKSKKPCWLNVTDLYWIRILVLLNCFPSTIIRSLIVSITWYYYFIVSASRKDIKIPLCLLALLCKRLI